MNYQDRLETNLLVLFAQTYNSECFSIFSVAGQHCCWTCKCETNNYYGCVFALNSSKQFWSRGKSKPWASAWWSKRHFLLPGNWD